MTNIIKEAGIGSLEKKLARGAKRWEDYDTIVCPDGSIIDMQKLLDDNDKAKAMCYHVVPAFGGLIEKLKFIYTFQVQTQATDGFNIYINPQFTDQVLDTPTKKVAVMLHEVLHCVLQHLRRGRDHDHEKSNVAADYEVNSTLVELGIIGESTWKEIHALYDKKYKDLGYETIYNMIPSPNLPSMDNQQGQKQAAKNQQGNQQGSPNKSGGKKPGGKGQEQDDSNNQQGNTPPQGTDGPTGGDQQGQQGSSNQNQQSQQGSGGNQGQEQSESGLTGRDDPDAPGKNQGKVRPQDCVGQALGGLKDCPSPAGGMIDKKTGDQIAESEGYDKSPGSEDSNDKEWQKEAEEVAHKANKIQGNGQAWGKFASKINGLNRVTTNWKKELAKVVGRSLSDEDKRQAFANKNILVSQDRIARTDKDKYDALNDIIALVDTSGSMSDEYKAACLRQVYQVANQKKPCRIVIIPFDDGPKKNHIVIYDNVKKLYNDLKNGKYDLPGGGGTDVRPCFDLLKSDPRFKKRIFELIMIFTDGYLDQMKRDRKICSHLCWVISDNTDFEVEYPEKNTYKIYMDQRDFE